MARINIALTAAEDKFELHPTGTHLLRIIASDVKVSKAGNDYVNWQLEVVDNPGNKSPVWLKTSLTPKALFNLEGLLFACGVEGKVDPGTLDTEDFHGKEFYAELGVEEYEGKQSNTVNRPYRRA